ncbi:probable 4-coumarate--CoA ligase 1 [Sitodiplosis mosellana]|uniref:probable 4-coumarate--CoA ligase 1 n=1 Tax=Sitodiplosis mosellana TaxID=263140 RepID=UPI0024453496|nr:probable 4-coumarate--CoA ligase 1 [Sitodiplosis mosellana]XP_055296140.1 probable 4-coumarate--CoA ligase 1 [Sitodiplosis mosellana]
MIEKYKFTYTMNAPHQMVLMLKIDDLTKADLSSLKICFVGGSKVPFYVQTEMNSILPNGHVHVAYGMSEMAGSVARDFPRLSGKDCVGRLVAGSHAKIIDDQGQRCGVNVNGEICFKMNYRFLGYYGNQKATDELFDDEGFLMTGDIGHFDDDGFLFIVDRKKDLLKYTGFHLSPSEIDAYLIQSPCIKSACVVGIPDGIANDSPAAGLMDRIIQRNKFLIWLQITSRTIANFEVVFILLIHYQQRLQGRF